jgi:hypothetical protein
MAKDKTILFISFVIVFVYFGASHAESCAKQETAYLIGSNSNNIFTIDTLEELSSCAGLVILNTPWYGESAEQNLKDIIQRIHEKRSDLDVLIYSWVSVWYERAIGRVGGYILADIKDKDSWFLEKRKDKYKLPVVFPDVRIQEYRDWIIRRISRAVEQAGADGVFIDMAFRSPGVMLKTCRKTPKKCAGYKEGFDRLLSDLKILLGNKQLYFNGIFSKLKIAVEDQLQTLKIADGVIIEYFGMDPKIGNSDFSKDILFYIELIRQHPDKKFLVFGRSPWASSSNEKSMSWGRYLYAAYQLIAADNTFFKYHASFQVPPHAGGTGGLFLLPELTATLGKPNGEYNQRGNLFERSFENGYVALCRHDAEKPETVEIPEEMNDIDGHSISGRKLLQAGEALILYKLK